MRVAQQVGRQLQQRLGSVIPGLPLNLQRSDPSILPATRYHTAPTRAKCVAHPRSHCRNIRSCTALRGLIRSGPRWPSGPLWFAADVGNGSRSVRISEKSAYIEVGQLARCGWRLSPRSPTGSGDWVEVDQVDQVDQVNGMPRPSYYSGPKITHTPWRSRPCSRNFLEHLSKPDPGTIRSPDQWPRIQF
jgi:hypothetical protein